MKAKFADISAYQRYDLGFFQGLWRDGYRGVVVKVTEGEGWMSPVWRLQCENALKVGFQVGVYHFARWSSPQNAVVEAQSFLRKINSFGFDRTTVCMVDCETNDYRLSGSTYQQCIKAWVNTVKASYPLTSVYASKSWWTSFINPYDIAGAIVWLAGYGITDFGGITNVGAWQWDDGQHNAFGVDTNWDYVGYFTSSKPAPKPAPEPQSKPQPQPKVKGFTDSLGDFWYYEKGTFTTATPINLRWGAKTNSSIIETLPTGSVIKYDAFSHHNGYVWLRQPRSNGYGYLASGQSSNGRRLNYWGKFS